MRALSTSFFFALLGLVVGSPALAQSPDAAASSTADSVSEQGGTIRVTIVDDTLEAKERKALRAEIDRVLTQQNEQHGLTLVEGETSDIFMRIEVSRPQRDAPLVIVQAIAKIGDDAIRGDTRTCLRCSSEELVAQAFEIFPAMVEMLGNQRAAAERAAAAEEPEPAPPPQTPAPTKPAKLAPLGPVGYVGIASSGLGLISAITGGVLLTLEPRYGLPGFEPWEFRNYEPPGLALLGVGLGMLVVGNVMLSVDLGPLAARRRDRAGSSQARVGMSVGPTGALVIAGRF
jgi:hypothetical protein